MGAFKTSVIMGVMGRKCQRKVGVEKDIHTFFYKHMRFLPEVILSST